MRTRVKICGITRTEDAMAAITAGADAIGLVFYPPSPRAVTITQAAQIVKDLPPFVSVVGLFVNPTQDELTEALAQVRLDLIQFHGDETAQMCEASGCPYIKAVRMRPDVDLLDLDKQFASASGLLLDSYQKGTPGGTGETFEWQRIPSSLRERIILAGGLSPDNVESAIHQVKPYAVDVSGGVEQAKGIKDHTKIKAFMRGVERANRETD
ncbi:phosphoribosylanthranilate isomerase [Sedimenticola selenatireducens]|uniref:N-(5'-phosphoribosyl)anthranilate isomerase n=1 Tax=Sedimenticola selenatireducens TaxID=191960 RepID=A0A557SJX8_9GAMM|nr:phosphoribosylanthranilate isomerase [Sedimenticola selenatireducens]TVO77719.1 phosphoribosylanthranilate isomerase [Sedimenticola selenatireducens]TVT65025.1 MAG: phosphoribosylanthranilate isomerase [Sedimenticola selenatireducens]